MLVNRHFKNEAQWKHADLELSSDGQYKYCAAWRKVPRFRDLYFPGLTIGGKDGKPFNGTGPFSPGSNNNNNNSTSTSTGSSPAGNNSKSLADLYAPGSQNALKPPVLNVQKVRVEVPCQNDVNIVLNDRNLELSKATKDQLGRKCTVWVNVNEQPENFKQYQERLASKGRN